MNAPLLAHLPEAWLSQLVAQVQARHEGNAVGAAPVSPASGMHASAHHGASLEFFEHAPYERGDDLRHVDWHASARGDRLLLKKFRHRGQLPRILLVDTTASMTIAANDGSEYVHKLHCACAYLAAFAFVMGRCGDPVVLGALGDGPNLSRPLGPGPALQYLQELAFSHATPGQPRELADALAQACKRLHYPRAHVVVASDLLDRSNVYDALASLRAAGHDVTVLHTLGRDEMLFPFRGMLRFRSPESGHSVLVNATDMARRYTRALREFLAHWQERCADARIEHLTITPQSDIRRILQTWLLGEVG